MNTCKVCTEKSALVRVCGEVLSVQSMMVLDDWEVLELRLPTDIRNLL